MSQKRSPDLLSIKAVAALKSCHHRSVQRAIAAGKIKARRVKGAPGARDFWAIEPEEAAKWAPDPARQRAQK